METPVPFCGIPTCTIDAVPCDAAAVVLGVGTSLGSALPGTENGPYFLRRMTRAHTWSATRPQIFELNQRTVLDQVVDLGDLDTGEASLDAVLAAVELIVSRLPGHVVPFVIGGDHSITLPIVRALAGKREHPFLVVQFDHHLDLQIWGEDFADTQTPREPIFNTNVMSHVSDVVGPGGVIQVGVGPLATFESSGADRIDSYLHRVGHQISITAAACHDPRALQAIVGESRDIYITVDVDVLASSEMSSTNYPAEIGLSASVLIEMINSILEKNTLIGFDMVEFAAPRDARDPKTLNDAARAALIFLEALVRFR
ncbi:arginase family protein [Nocardia sp. NPDC047648]|uniref:arginase family protein n=1 Tax=Nocardia sp. NPDC047648 TaxID=3155625 RepID=UPI0033C07625